MNFVFGSDPLPFTSGTTHLEMQIMRGKWKGNMLKGHRFLGVWFTDGHLCDSIFESCHFEFGGIRFCRVSRVYFLNCTFLNIRWKGNIYSEVVLKGSSGEPLLEPWSSSGELPKIG